MDANILSVLIDVFTNNKVKIQPRFCLGDRTEQPIACTVLIRTGEAVASSKRVFAGGRGWVEWWFVFGRSFGPEVSMRAGRGVGESLRSIPRLLIMGGALVS